MSPDLRPALAGLSIADPPERWEALGFSVSGDGRLALGGVGVQLGADGQGIVGWTLRHVPEGIDVDGLTTSATVDEPPPSAPHPNGATGIDHVVITTGDFDRTARSLEPAGLTLRRVRDAGGFRQGFRRLGPAIMEVVEVPEQTGGARFWGLVVVVSDLAALSQRLGPQLAPIRPAIQPGRRIATLSASGGLSVAVAFMDPEALTR